MRIPPDGFGREIQIMAVMMRSILEVADNSGARKLQMILPLGGSTGLNAGLVTLSPLRSRKRRRTARPKRVRS